MTTRAYDFAIQLANAAHFSVSDVLIGTTSNTVSEIVSIAGNVAKVRLSNVLSSYISGETVYSNATLLYTANVISTYNFSVDGYTYLLPEFLDTPVPDSILVYVNNELIDKGMYTVAPPKITLSPEYFELTSVEPFSDAVQIQFAIGETGAGRFISSNAYGEITTGSSTITSISGNPYIAEKNSTVQTPIVKLYTIYYPGEWYPIAKSGNPGADGEGFPWPVGFPLRFAEFIGEEYSDFDYSVISGNIAYKTVAMNGSDISQESSGKISSTSIEIANFDGSIVKLVENPNLVGFNASNSTVAMVNGDLLTNIDPATVFGNLAYDPVIAQKRGANAAHTYESTVSRGEIWTPLKDDTRDLLGAVVEIKLTYAKFLDFWPEYSIVSSASANTVDVRNAAPYRIGDSVKYSSNVNGVLSVITDIVDNTLYLSNTITPQIGDRLYIQNFGADPDSYVKYVFNVSRLEEVNELVAKFELTNWSQNFNKEIPKRKFFGTCPWKYKGAECKYPGSGVGTIVGSVPLVSANGYFTIDDQPTNNPAEDACSHTLRGCMLRHNLINFGGFIDE